MKIRVSRLLRVLAACLVRGADAIHVPPSVEDPIRTAAKALVWSAENMAASGEYRRHWVYARLLKRFPEADKPALGLMIETVLSEIRSNQKET